MNYSITLQWQNKEKKKRALIIIIKLEHRTSFFICIRSKVVSISKVQGLESSFIRAIVSSEYYKPQNAC